MSVMQRGKVWAVRLQIDGVKISRSMGIGSTREDAEECEARLRLECIKARRERKLHGRVKKAPAPKANHAPVHYLYRHYDKDGRLLYIGMSLSAVLRLLQHRSTAPWWNDIVTVTIARFGSRQEVCDAERIAIATEGPLHNVQRPAP